MAKRTKRSVGSNLPDNRQRSLLGMIFRHGRISRWAMHQESEIHPNVIGKDVARLLEIGAIVEAQADRTKPGRPQTPLEIDRLTRNVVGLAIEYNRVEVGRLNLRGELLGRLTSQKIADPAGLVPAAKKLLKGMIGEDTVGVGISTPGFLDAERHTILFNAFVPNQSPMSIEPVFDVIGDQIVVFENDIHALAARWLLTHLVEQDDDVLLVYFGDDCVGSAVLIEGRPNRGCLIGANELGHMRYFVDTDRCYCGQTGCLEQICNTEFLNRGNERGTRLSFADTDPKHPRMVEVLKYLSNGIANVVNFVRPNRLVLVNGFPRNPSFNDRLSVQIRGLILPQLEHRTRIDFWDQPAPFSAETAGWLALVGLYGYGWTRMTDPQHRQGKAE